MKTIVGHLAGALAERAASDDPFAGANPAKVRELARAFPLDRNEALYPKLVEAADEISAAWAAVEEKRRAIIAQARAEGRDRPDPNGPEMVAVFAPLLARWGSVSIRRRYAVGSVAEVGGAAHMRAAAVGQAIEAAYRADESKRPAGQKKALAEIEAADRELMELELQRVEGLKRVRASGGVAGASPAILADLEAEGRKREAQAAEVQARRAAAVEEARRWSAVP